MYNRTEQMSNVPLMLLGPRVLTKEERKFNYGMGDGKTNHRIGVSACSWVPRHVCMCTHVCVYMCMCVHGMLETQIWFFNLYTHSEPIVNTTVIKIKLYKLKLNYIKNKDNKYTNLYYILLLSMRLMLVASLYLFSMPCSVTSPW